MVGVGGPARKVLVLLAGTAAVVVGGLAGAAHGQVSRSATLTISPTSGPVGTTISFSGQAAVCDDEAAEDAEVFFLFGNFAGNSQVNPRVKVETDDATGAFSGTIVAPNPVKGDRVFNPAIVDVRCLGPDGEHDSGAISSNAPEFTFTDLAAPTTSTIAPATVTTTTAAAAPAAPATGTAGAAVQPQATQSPGQASSSTLAPGDQLVITGGGFAPGADLTATFFSDPVVVGTTRADANGQFSIRVTIPAGASPGVHRIVVSGRGPQGGPHECVVTVTVAVRTGQALVRTGTDSGQLTGTAALVILAGALLVLVGAPKSRVRYRRAATRSR